MQEGLIVKALSGFYYIRPDGGGDIVACRARGLFKLHGQSPLVGDRVRFERKQDQPGEGTVVEILPRKTELVRPPIANVDTALIVFSAAQPEPNRRLLDKFLALAELAGLRPVLAFTKTDLLERDDAEDAGDAPADGIASWVRLYERIGYPVFLTNKRDETAIDALRRELAGRITVVAGQSGVGKSTLLNRLVPGLQLATNEISTKLGRGRHTTRHVELFPLDGGGLVADTPGFSSLEFPEMEPEELGAAFPEIAELSEGCRYRGCLHLAEPGCRVSEAAKEGELDPVRYEHYVAFAAEIRDRKRRY